MLHNTGLYGSNETPVNMGAPLNISQLSTPMNMVQNLNNLSKMPAQPPPTASGHFNQPNYAPYGNPPVNVNPQMHPFQNYHSLGYQHGYAPQNSTVMQNTTWQNAMLPMSLNMHGDHTPNMLNYAHIDKRLSQPVPTYKDQHYGAKTPLNIPQVPNKLFPKHSDPALNPENAFNTIYKQLNMLKEANNMELGLKSPEHLMFNNVKDTNNLDFSMKTPESLLYSTLKDTRNLDVGIKSPENILYNKSKEMNNLDLSIKSPENRLFGKSKETEFELRIKSPESLLPHKSNEENNLNLSLKSPDNLLFKTRETNNFDHMKSSDNLLFNKTKESNPDCDMQLPESVHFNTLKEAHLDLSMKSPENLPYNKSKETNVEHNIKSPESLLYDNTRRKNLENTVRLIENILINTTKNREMKQNNEQNESEENPNYDDNITMEAEVSQSKISQDVKSNKVPNDAEIDEDALDDIPEDSDYNESMSVDSISNKSSSKEVEKIEKQEVKKQSDEDESQSSVIMESSIQVEIDPVIIKEEPPDEDEMGRQVVVKIEKMTSWADTDHMTPFHRDINGITKEAALHENIIDSESSVMEAMDVVKNGSGKKSENYYECPHCALLFEHPKRFLIHAKWHGFGLINVQRHQVAIVKQERRKEKEEARRISKIELTDPNGKLYPCKHCDKVYQAKGSLDGHRQRCHKNRSRDCKLCNKTISGGWSAWRNHQQSHSTEAGYQCNECPKRFKYSHSLAKHKDTHLEKTHACPEPDCPKKFGSQALLKVHLKSHERAKQGASFHCTYCGKSFYDKFNLQIHERKHTNERPFICEICNATFGCNSNLSRHLKVSHSASKPHVCSTCNRSFATALIRDRHELRVHGDPEEFKYICKQCPSRYMKQVDLRKHTYKMHPKQKSEKAKE